MATKLLTPHQAAGPVAVAVRLKDPEAEAVARRNLAEAKIAASIDKALAVAPPLTTEQIKRLSGLLRGGAR